MAISNLVAGQGQSFNRPGISAFFGAGKNPSNDNVQKVSSSMFDETFFTNVIQALTSLGAELSRVQETANKTVLGLNKVISSLKDLTKNITQRFGALNAEISANRVDLARNIINAPAVPAIEDGLPIVVTKDDKPVTTPDTPSGGGGAFDLLAGLAALGITKDIISGIARIGGSLFTKLGAFLLTPAGAGLLAGSLVAFGIYEFIGKANKELLDKLGIKEGMSQDEIKQRKQAYFAQRREAPMAEMAQLRILAEEVLDGKHDEELGIKPSDNAKQSQETRQKVAEDLLRAVPIVDPRLSNSMPKIMSRSERRGEEPGYSGEAGKVLQDATGTTPAAPPPSPTAPAGTPTPAPSAPSATPAPTGKPQRRGALSGAYNRAAENANKDQVGGRDLDQQGMQDDTGIDVGQHDEELKMTGLPLKVSRELSGDSAYKQGEINRYVTDPRPDVPLGSVADLMYNGNEDDRKKRYLDYQTNPDAAGKSPMQAGYQFSGLSDQYDKNGNLVQGSRSRSSVSFGELAARAGRPEASVLRPGEGIMDKLSPGMPGYGAGGATVINTSSSTNIGSTEGGEANNVAGTNLPLSAINPHIQEFLAKQNLQYQ